MVQIYINDLPILIVLLRVRMYLDIILICFEINVAFTALESAISMGQYEMSLYLLSLDLKQLEYWKYFENICLKE